MRESGEMDLRVPGGRLHAELGGPGTGPLVLCLPGLSANLRGFDVVAPRLAAAGLRVAAVDLRGRGRSDISPPGTYGWAAHAADAEAAAAELRAARFSVVGWSMGAFVAMQLAARARERIERLVLLDACSRPSEEVLALVRLSVERLGTTYPSAADYMARMRALPTIERWSEFWERYFGYELTPAEGGVRARTSRAAVLEDLAYGDEHDPRTLWPALTMPVLLLRAARPLVPGGPWLLTPGDVAEFKQRVRAAEALEINQNHYGIAAAPETAEATAQFLVSGSVKGSKTPPG
jgi:pimeloyl-ACP methyl ester carboxylesterase